MIKGKVKKIRQIIVGKRGQCILHVLCYLGRSALEVFNVKKMNLYITHNMFLVLQSLEKSQTSN